MSVDHRSLLPRIRVDRRNFLRTALGGGTALAIGHRVTWAQAAPWS